MTIPTVIAVGPTSRLRCSGDIIEVVEDPNDGGCIQILVGADVELLIELIWEAYEANFTKQEVSEQKESK